MCQLLIGGHKSLVLCHDLTEVALLYHMYFVKKQTIYEIHESKQHHPKHFQTYMNS